MKWVWIVLGAGLLIGGGYFVLTHGGALEMQPEHAVEAPAHAPAGDVKK
jgi:hypothetical protein